MAHHSLLVVENDADVRGALAALLEFEGHDVVEAKHGREAVEVLRAAEPGRFCLIVLDIFMPVMDGWMFRAEQLKDPSLASIPVVVLTADVGAVRHPLPGVVAALKKPVDFDCLVGTVQRHC